jgi:outer membrane biosynthesis protein TonB
MAHSVPHTGKTNGVGASGTHAPPAPVNSDVLQMLNLPGASQQAPGAPPKLMSLTGMMEMGAGTTVAPAPRSKSAVYLLALLGVVGAVVIAVTVTLKKPPRPPTVVVTPPPAPAPEPVVAKPPEPPPAPPVEPVVEPPPRGKQAKHGKVTKPIASATKPPPPGVQTVAPPPGGGDAARFRDNHNLNINPGSGGGSRLPPPAQADITKVISNNRAGIKICYQRALTRDNSLTHGKLSVKLSIGISGRVKHVGLDGPTQFRTLLEPCIKEVVQRWVFPQSSEEYGTEFPLVFQGNE